MDIVIYPHPSLTRPTKKVGEIDDEVRERVEEMFRLMGGARGVGLAAPQVDWSVRLFVVNATGEEDGRQVFINPKILKRIGARKKAEEGCLSLPNITCKVERHERVKVRARGLDGEWFEKVAEDLEARVIQHEYDHLEGILITDKASPVERLTLRKKLKKLRNNYQERLASQESGV